MKKNYLQWLAEDTPTKWWHDSAVPEEIEEAIENGALGVTTNPVLTYKSLQACPDFWEPQVSHIPKDMPAEERAEALLSIVAQYAAERFKPIYIGTHKQHGYALGQLNPAICSDSEKMLAQALRYVSWGENIAVKLPTVKAALPVIEELASRGIAVCTTLNFSVAQAMAAGEAYERGAAKARSSGVEVRPCFVVQQGGRLDEYLVEVVCDNRIPVGLADVHNAGNAVCKKVYHLFKERNITAKIMPAGLRGVHHLAEMAGGDMVFSLQHRVQRMAVIEDLPKIRRIDDPIPEKTVGHLMNIPEFVRAYEEDGLDENEFVTFGVTQKTLSQFFWTGWAPLETHGSQYETDRWF